MWHASIAAHGIALPPFRLLEICSNELDGVGTGEPWTEVTDRAAHVRRRVSPIELVLLPEEHRQTVDVRDRPFEELLELIKPALESAPPERRPLIEAHLQAEVDNRT